MHSRPDLRIVFAAAIACATLAGAQQRPAHPVTLRSSLDRQLSGVEHEFVALAEAMPADKYGYAPTQGQFQGVRTFAQQVKHAAAVNYLVFSAMLGQKPPAGVESGPADLTSKDQIVRYLRDSFALGHRAIAGITAANASAVIRGPFGPDTRPALVAMDVGHNFDHYGQCVEYLRDNGIVPPASRR